MPGSVPRDSRETPTPTLSDSPKLPPAAGTPDLSDEERLQRLTFEAEKLQTLLTSLTSKTLSGTNPLESKWREVQTLVEKNPDKKRSVSVARLHGPLKNRVADVLPFDETRVELENQKDDYINASQISLGPKCPNLIVTQAPTPHTLTDFWAAVWQEQVETIVCLIPDQDLGAVLYIPLSKSQVLNTGHFQISLQSSKSCSSHTERVVNICHATTKQTRAVVHLQLLGWPGPDLPSSPAPIIDTVMALITLHKQQRVASHPVMVHCLDGGSKSGTFIVLLSLISEMETRVGPSVPSSPGFPDVTNLFATILCQRKGIVRDKEYMNLVYEILLYYMQDTLMKQGILTKPAASGLKTHNRHPSQDFILGPTSIATTRNKAEVAVQDPSMEQIEVNLKDSEAQIDVKPPEKQQEENLPILESSQANEKRKENEDSVESSVVQRDMTGIPDDLSKLVDFSTTDSPSKRKFTKEDFMKPSQGIGGETDPADPLSQLDPLWSLK